MEILKKYNLDNNGIYVIEKEKVDTAFSAKTQNNLLDIEEGSWWFLHRAHIIEYIATHFLDKSKPVYDIGGGNGYTSSLMHRRGWITNLVEPSYQACINAKERGNLDIVICGTVSEDSFYENCFESVMLLDVLEHIKDDSKFLKILKEKVENNGYLLLTVPASMKLWSSEDDYAGHYRRYSLKSLRDTLHSAGWEIVYANYFFSFLYIPIFFVRHLGEKMRLVKTTKQRSEKESEKIYDKEFKVKNGFIAKILSFLEAAELNRIKKGKNIFFGSSIICVVK